MTSLSSLIAKHCRLATEPELRALLPKGERALGAYGLSHTLISTASMDYIDCTTPYHTYGVQTADIRVLSNNPHYLNILAPDWEAKVLFTEDHLALVAALKEFNYSLVSKEVERIFTDLQRPPKDKLPDWSILHEGLDDMALDYNTWQVIELPYLNGDALATTLIFRLDLPFVGDHISYYILNDVSYRTTRYNFIQQLALQRTPEDARPAIPPLLTLSDLEDGKRP